MKTVTYGELCGIFKNEGINPDDLQTLLVKRLTQLGKTAATAESCTGGLISKRITEVSGASAVFGLGVCSYANEIKERVLGVRRETLDSVGAVSPETAEQMACGVMRLARSDLGVSTTGIAGPTGGTAEKPVGLVYICACCESSREVIKATLGDMPSPSREKIRKAASDAALYMLLKAAES